MKMLIDNRLAAAPRIDPRRTAVLAIHWQNDLLEPQGAFGPIFAAPVRESGLVPRMQRLLDGARAAGATIVYVNVAFSPRFDEVICNSALFSTAIKTRAFVRGTHGARICDALRPQDGDFVVEHSRISAFFGNDLVLLLRKRGIECVAVTGVATNVAVDHTVRDALQLGYQTLLVEDCCCSSSAAFHEAAMMTLRVLCTEVTSAEDLLQRMRIPA